MNEIARDGLFLRGGPFQGRFAAESTVASSTVSMRLLATAFALIEPRLNVDGIAASAEAVRP